MATPKQRNWCVLQLAKKESVTAVQREFRTQFHMEPPSRVSVSQYPCTRITTAIASITRDTAQSLGRGGLSSRHLPCASRSTYRVPVRCVQNFENFSIDWCRCEVLSTPHLFSVSFCKSKVLLCSLCILRRAEGKTWCSLYTKTRFNVSQLKAKLLLLRDQSSARSEMKPLT
jgi:hypothetical protein